MSCPGLLRASLLLLPAFFVIGCEDEEPVASPDAAVSLSDAAPSEAGAPDGAGVGAGGTAALGLVVVQTDYKSSSVSLVDPVTGTVTKDDCINSGSKPAQVTTVLSADVVTPSQPQPGNEVLLIDRQNATLTWVSPRTCEVARQMNVGQSKMSNPQDVITISATKAYVTRYDSSASDLLVINPTTAAITGRVDLKPHAPKAAGDKVVLPNPSRGLYARGKVYVVLVALSDDTKVGAPGRVVVVDPATDTVTGTIDLPALKNCASATWLESDGALLVGCGGMYGDPNQTTDSGVAWIDVMMTPPVVKVAAAKDFGRALSPFDVAAASTTQAYTITGGDFSGTPPDQLWTFGFAGAAPRKLLDAKKAFTLNGLLVDRTNKKLFIAEAADAAPKLHVFDLDNAAGPTLQTSLTTAASGLPPRYVGWY